MNQTLQQRAALQAHYIAQRDALNAALTELKKDAAYPIAYVMGVDNKEHILPPDLPCMRKLDHDLQRDIQSEIFNLQLRIDNLEDFTIPVKL